MSSRSIAVPCGAASRSVSPSPGWPTTISTSTGRWSEELLRSRPPARDCHGPTSSRCRARAAASVMRAEAPRPQPETVAPAIDALAEASFYIPSTSPSARPRRTLKHADTFAIFDSHGDMGASAGGPDGLFNHDTRFLSRLELLLGGTQPLLLGSSVRDDNVMLSVDLTNA